MTEQPTFEVIDTRNDCAVVATFPTHRRALNYTKKLEPKATQGVWRYLIRPKKGQPKPGV